ncbi:MAG: type II secretion system F family protein, partial [Candidatus Aenigmatarchaeota archaeon]
NMMYKDIGKKFLKFFPDLELKIRHAEIKQSPENYLGRAITVAAALAAASFLAVLVGLIFLPEKAALKTFLIVLPLSAFALVMVYNLMRPRLIIAKRVSDIERNLLFSLRHLLIEIRAGISLHEAFISVGKSNYGALSAEFRKVTKMISMGISEKSALEEVMLKNPSINFRRALWQITSAIEAGSNLGNILEELVREFAAEQRTAIRMYGSQLNSMALIYMIFAIITPSIGICFLIILSFFSGLPVNKGMLLLIMIFVTVFQFMFVGIVKSKRPKIE